MSPSEQPAGRGHQSSCIEDTGERGPIQGLASYVHRRAVGCGTFPNSSPITKESTGHCEARSCRPAVRGPWRRRQRPHVCAHCRWGLACGARLCVPAHFSLRCLRWRPACPVHGHTRRDRAVTWTPAHSAEAWAPGAAHPTPVSHRFWERSVTFLCAAPPSPPLPPFPYLGSTRHSQRKRAAKTDTRFLSSSERGPVPSLPPPSHTPGLA